MEALTEKLTNLLLPISNALNNNKHLTAVKNAMMFTIRTTTCTINIGTNEFLLFFLIVMESLGNSEWWCLIASI